MRAEPALIAGIDRELIAYRELMAGTKVSSIQIVRGCSVKWLCSYNFFSPRHLNPDGGSTIQSAGQKKKKHPSPNSDREHGDDRLEDLGVVGCLGVGSQ
jgi:hypothetical protein